MRASDLHIKRALKRLRRTYVPSAADTRVGRYDPANGRNRLARIARRERRPAGGWHLTAAESAESE